jgi:hypothetical protein
MPGKKIPTIIGLGIVVSTIVLLSYAFNRMSPLMSRASVYTTPENVTFSNITDTSFTVTWTTQVATQGFLSITNPLKTNFIAYDERDGANVPSSGKIKIGSYKTHIVTVRNAQPNTLYQVIVQTNSAVSPNARPYHITTGPTLANPPTYEPSYGSVSHQDGSPADSAIVLVTLEGSQTLSTYVSPAGTWVIPLNFIRSEDLQSYLPTLDRVTEQILIQTNNAQSKAVTDTKNDHPVPSMVLGKEYDFRKIQANIQQFVPSITLFPTKSKQAVQTNLSNVSLTSPKNGSALATDIPLFEGTGIPGHDVLLVVGITKPTTGNVKVGPDGVWRYTPKISLAAGRQSVTVSTKDAKGKTIAMTNMFEILKSGTQVLGDATPSGALIPTLLPTSTPAPTVELFLSPTSMATGSPIPNTGISTPYIFLGSLGTLLFLAGVYMFIF